MRPVLEVQACFEIQVVLFRNPTLPHKRPLVEAASCARHWRLRHLSAGLRSDYRLTQSTSPVEASTATSIYRPALSRP
jgi:hypothetical protein